MLSQAENLTNSPAQSKDFLRLTPIPVNFNLKAMEVRLNPDLQAKLVQLASQQGRDTEDLVVSVSWLMRIRWTPSATGDLTQIFDYIKKQGSGGVRG